MINKIKITISIYLIVILTVFPFFPVVAQEAPIESSEAVVEVLTTPTASETTVEPQTTPESSSVPEVTPEVVTEPSVSPTPAPENTNPGSNTLEQTPPQESTDSESSTQETQTENLVPTEAVAEDNLPVQTETTGGIVANGNVGDTVVETGDITSTGNISTAANTNLGIQPSSDSGITVANDTNGVASNNQTDVVDTSSTTTNQQNQANVINSLNQSTDTGQNSTSLNVGESVIVTGNATTTGTIVTAVNTNADQVAVSEFNMSDNQQGDVILNFAESCISNCGVLSTSTTNQTNGTGSQNTNIISQENSTSTFQNNDAAVASNLTLSANTGDNIASQNTSGNSEIQTGNASVAANVLTFANNNIAGPLVYGVVNIVGTYIGDIILPQAALGGGTSETGTDTNLDVENSGNGTSSINNTQIDETVTDVTFQQNEAIIDNNFVLAATTGDNITSQNTRGDSIIESGDASVAVNTLNIANNNVSGGSFWFVVINKAGEWVGKIIGAPDGATYAGSSNTDFNVGDNGEINVQNTGNGRNSENQNSVSQTESSETTQTNTARIENNLNLSANTGRNESSQNTGGDSIIKTGDAEIIVNLVNFVNNNFAHQVRPVILIINIFKDAKWVGDFISPGVTKENPEDNNPEPTPTPSIPAPTQTPSNPGDQSGSNNNNSGEGNQVSNSSTTNGDQGGTGSVLGLKIRRPNIPDTGLVAGEKIEVTPEGELPFVFEELQDKSKKAVTSINLAWLLLFLPVLLIIIKSRSVYRLVKKGH